MVEKFGVNSRQIRLKSYFKELFRLFVPKLLPIHKAMSGPVK
jgi:hypothetical protein